MNGFTNINIIALSGFLEIASNVLVLVVFSLCSNLLTFNMLFSLFLYCFLYLISVHTLVYEVKINK